METDQPLPKNRAGEPEQHTPFEIHQNHEYFQKEYLIAVAEVKLMQARAVPRHGPSDSLLCTSSAVSTLCAPLRRKRCASAFTRTASTSSRSARRSVRSCGRRFTPRITGRQGRHDRCVAILARSPDWLHDTWSIFFLLVASFEPVHKPRNGDACIRLWYHWLSRPYARLLLRHDASRLCTDRTSSRSLSLVLHLLPAPELTFHVRACG